MKTFWTFLFSIYCIVTASGQTNLIFKTILGTDGYDLNYDDMFYSGAKLGFEAEMLKNFTMGASIGYNSASANSHVLHYGFDMKYYFGRKSVEGFFTELSLSHNPFKFKNTGLTDPSQLPNNTYSIFANVGIQKIYKEHICIAFKGGGGTFTPYFANGNPPMRLQVALEIGYRF
jgi:hypothetical protein